MLFSWFELLLLMGVTQGLITSILLLVSDRNKRSNRYLALTLIAFCLLSIKMIFNTLGLANSNPLFHFLPLATELAIAPLIYLYSVSLIRPENKLSKTLLIHFAPFILFQAYAIFIYSNLMHIEPIAEKIALAQGYHYPIVKDLEDYITVASIVAYLSAGLLKIKAYRKHVRDNISDSSQPTLSWLINIFMLSVVLLIFLVANMLVGRLTNLEAYSMLHWQLYFIYIACIIYYLGFRAYQLPELKISPLLTQASAAGSKKLTSQKIEHVATIFKNTLLENKLYLKPTVNAQEISKIIGISQSHLSYAINQFFGKSFRDIINELRIDEVKLRLMNDDYHRVSVLAIALECGFNSEASFYRIFKNSTGMSPKAFSAQYRN